MWRWQSGQMRLAVNQLPSGYEGSNPSRHKSLTEIYVINLE